MRENRKMWKDLLCIAAVFLAVILAWLYIKPVRSDLERTVVAGVYREGQLIAYTEVEIDGEIDHYLLTGDRSYWGRFAIECVPWTTRDGVTGGISLNAEYDGFTYSSGGTLTNELYDLDTYVNRDLAEFALALTKPDDARGWYILASSPMAYESYRSHRAGYSVPPELVSPQPEELPKMQSPW